MLVHTLNVVCLATSVLPPPHSLLYGPDIVDQLISELTEHRFSFTKMLSEWRIMSVLVFSTGVSIFPIYPTIPIWNLISKGSGEGILFPILLSTWYSSLQTRYFSIISRYKISLQTWYSSLQTRYSSLQTRYSSFQTCYSSLQTYILPFEVQT